jgi:hypothetical protein
VEDRFRGILDELTGHSPYSDKSLFIENRAQQVIASFTNLRRLIENSFEPDVAEELTRRLLLAAKSGDGRKFTRKLTEVRKGRDEQD